MNHKLQKTLELAVALSGRPDLEEELLHAIKTVTLRLHGSLSSQEDLVSQLITTRTPSHAAQLPLPPNLRKLVAVCKVVPDEFHFLGYEESTPLRVLEDLKEILSSLGKSETDVAYNAGDAIQVRSSTTESRYMVKYFAYPNVTDTGYSTHLDEEVIVAEALKLIQLNAA